jgi:hypothetical protein
LEQQLDIPMKVIDARGWDRLDRPWRSSALERHR